MYVQFKVCGSHHRISPINKWPATGKRWGSVFHSKQSPLKKLFASCFKPSLCPSHFNSFWTKQIKSSVDWELPEMVGLFIDFGHPTYFFSSIYSPLSDCLQLISNSFFLKVEVTLRKLKLNESYSDPGWKQMSTLQKLGFFFYYYYYFLFY